MKQTSRRLALGVVAALALFTMSSSALAHRVWSDWFVLLPNGWYSMNHHAGQFGRIYVGYEGARYTRVQNNTQGTWIHMQANQFCSDGSEDWSTSGSTWYLGTRTTTSCPLFYNPSWGRGLMGEP